jgi:uncharacterized RDD family membrane protein YckC
MSIAAPDLSSLPPPVALWRRFAAMFYDTLALIGIWFVAGGIAVGLEHGVAVPADSLLFKGVLILSSYLYFAFCWRRGGQTLGMKSWRLRVVNDSGARLGWGQTLLRFGVGLLAWLPLAFGYWWALADPQGRTWTDRASASRLIRVVGR